MTITNAVILRMNKLLAERKMTKRRLAREGGLSEGTIASIYKQIAKGVSLTTIFAISRGFNMTPAEFLNDELFNNVEID
ncbi:MAG: helix-turn-helix domain-containing protein [Candidatus Coproplasma sp.]